MNDLELKRINLHNGYLIVHRPEKVNGLFIPDTAKSRVVLHYVLKNNSSIVGDKVMVLEIMNQPILIDGKECLIVHETDIAFGYSSIEFAKE